MDDRIMERLNGACSEGYRWLKRQPNVTVAWNTCKRGDWMLWILLGVSIFGTSDVDKRRFVLSLVEKIGPYISNKDEQGIFQALVEMYWRKELVDLDVYEVEEYTYRDEFHNASQLLFILRTSARYVNPDALLIEPFNFDGVNERDLNAAMDRAEAAEKECARLRVKLAQKPLPSWLIDIAGFAALMFLTCLLLHFLKQDIERQIGACPCLKKAVEEMDDATRRLQR